MPFGGNSKRGGGFFNLSSHSDEEGIGSSSSPTPSTVPPPEELELLKMRTIGVPLDENGSLKRRAGAQMNPAAAAALKQQAARSKRSSVTGRVKLKNTASLAGDAAAPLDDFFAHPVTDEDAASPEVGSSSHNGKASSHHYIPKVPHTHLHSSHGEVLPVAVLLSHSPFAYVAKDATLLEKLAKAFVTIRFSRGDMLPSSPFYLVARGSVASRAMADGRPIATKRAGAFINWTTEFTTWPPSTLSSAIFSCLPGAATKNGKSTELIALNPRPALYSMYIYSSHIAA